MRSYTPLEEEDYQSIDRKPKFYIGDDLNRSSSHLQDQKKDSMELSESEMPNKQVIVGICAMAKKSGSKPMKEILTRLEEFEYIRTVIFPEDVILNEPIDKWPLCDCLISFHSKGFPLAKAIEYTQLREPFVISELNMQYDIQDRRKVYRILEDVGIELPRYAVLDRDSPNPDESEIIESEDHIEVNSVTFNKPFVEKPISAEDHNIYIYYPTSAGGGSQRLFRKIGSRSSVYSPESKVRKTGSYIYEEFMPTDGTDVKVYTVGPDYAHAEARKSPALDGKVERDKEGKEVRYPIILSNEEKMIARKVCLAFKQTVCGFDLLRANGKSYVCDVNGFSFVKNSLKYYDDCAKILGNMILRYLAPQLNIPWSIPFQLDDPQIVPTTFGKMMELRCVIAVIRHGDRTPKQKMKMEVKHPKFFEIFERHGGYKDGHIKLKKPKQLQELLDISRYLLSEMESDSEPDIEEDKAKLEQLKSVLEMYGHFSGINRKVQMKYQPKGRPRRSSSEEDLPREPSLVLILKWGGELTPAGRVQAEELGRIFRCMYPGGQGEYAGIRGLGLLRLHSTFRHDLKIYASDEGRVQMTAAAFAKGLLALEGELTPILVQMVKSANTNGLLDNDCDSSKCQNMVKQRLHEYLQQNRDFTEEDYESLNPTRSRSILNALKFIKNPFAACTRVYELIQELNLLIKVKRDSFQNQEYHLYHGETWDLMQRRWSKLEKDFKLKNDKFDISKIPDIYDCIKYDLQHNQHTLQFSNADELYMYAKALADIVIPQEYGISKQEKLTIGLGICSPLLKKIRSDLLRNYSEDESESVNRLNPRYSYGVSSPGRHVRTRLYFTSESHIHSLLSVFHYGGMIDEQKEEQWRRAMDYVSTVSELNYMTQIVIMLYEDPTKDITSKDRFHVEVHFSPGVVCSVQKNIPKGPGFRPQARNALSKRYSEFNHSSNPCSIKEEELDELIVEDESKDCESPEHSAYACSTPESPTLLEQSTADSIHQFSSVQTEKEAVKTNRKSSSPIFIKNSSNSKSKVKASNSSPEDNSEFEEKLIVRSNSMNDSCSSQITKKEISRKPEKPAHFKSLDNVSNISDNKTKSSSRSTRLSSYLRLCSVVDLPHYGSTSSLFSTAVISGSSSAPELKNVLHPSSDFIPNISTIRPLETLHNALSLKQLESFLERMTITSNSRASLSQACAKETVPSSKSNHIVISPTNSFGCSGPPSFVSSSGPSSPNSSQLDLWKLNLKSNNNDSDLNTAEYSDPGSNTSYSGPPSPLDPKLSNS